MPHLVTNAFQQGPVSSVPAINPNSPLAPIFVSRSAPPNSETSHFEADLPNAPAELEIISQQETFVQPLPNPSQLLNDLPLKEETDGVSEPGADCNGIDGDATEASSVFTDDSDEESLTKFPSLVIDAFHKQIEYLKQVTEGQGRASKHLVYDKLKSFWLPQTTSFFLSPSTIFVSRYFIDPTILLLGPSSSG